MENLPAVPEPSEYDDFTVPVEYRDYPLKLSDGEVINCTIEDTTLYFFKGVLEVMNHIYHIRENGQPLYLFNSDRVMKEMKEMGFDRYISRTPPSVFDLKVFFGYAKNKISNDAIKFLEDK